MKSLNKHTTCLRDSPFILQVITSLHSCPVVTRWVGLYYCSLTEPSYQCLSATNFGRSKIATAEVSLTKEEVSLTVLMDLLSCMSTSCTCLHSRLAVQEHNTQQWNYSQLVVKQSNRAVVFITCPLTPKDDPTSSCTVLVLVHVFAAVS